MATAGELIRVKSLGNDMTRQLGFDFASAARNLPPWQ
jgi:hypothetical protein